MYLVLTIGLLLALALFNVSGTVYDDQGVTTMGSGRTVKLSVNGAAALGTTAGTTTTDSSGNFTFTGVSGTVPVLTVYLQGNTEVGVTVIVATGINTAVTGLVVYRDCLVLQRPTGAAANPSGANINTSDNNGASGITSIYSSSASSSFTVASGKALYYHSTLTTQNFTSVTAISCGGGFVNAQAAAGSASVTMTFTGSGTITTGGVTSYANLVFNCSGTYTLQDNLVLTTSAGTSLTLTAGTLDCGNFNITVPGSWANGGGSFTAGSGTVTMNNPTAGGATTFDPGSSSFFNFVNGRTSSTLTLTNNNLTVTGALTQGAAGTFVANGLTVTVTGLTTISAGIYQSGAATNTFNGGLTISGGTLTGGAGTITVAGNATLSSGVLTAPSGTMNVSGNWNKTGGTFTHNSGTVNLNGSSQQINGTQGSTFSTLTKTISSADTLTFNDGVTQTVATAITLQGASGQLLTIQSDNPGTAFTISLPATQTFAYLNVIDSTATTNTGVAGATSTNGGGNTNWTFGGAGFFGSPLMAIQAGSGNV